MAFKILWKGWIGPDQIEMKKVPSTLNPLSKEDVQKLQKVLLDKPSFADWPKWRYEGVEEIKNGIAIKVSETSYLPHFVLRNEKGRDRDPLIPENIQYPNPASINSVPITSDGFIVIGVKGGISDQRGIGAIGGFLEVKEPPEDPFSATERETTEETVNLEKNAIDIPNSRIMGSIYGSNRDTTFATYIPLKCKADAFGLSAKEHAAKITIPATEKRLELFLNGEIETSMNEIYWNDKKSEEIYNQGRMVMTPVDHCYGDLHLLLENKKAGRI